MKNETAKKRIRNEVEKRFHNEAQFVKDYLCDCVFLTYQANQYDWVSYENDTDCLNDAIDINLEFEINNLILEARSSNNG